MRVAALYDIHGNLPALEGVLADLRSVRVDRIVVGGDVLPGPMPRETLERLLNLGLPVQFILGNGDREVLSRLTGEETAWYLDAPEESRAPVRWSAEQLADVHAHELAAWPATLRLEVDGLGAVCFCHATPRSDTEIFTRRTPEARLEPIFAGGDAALVVCGHTHMQFERKVGPLRVVNAGSVGMPFGERGACWVLLGPDVELRRTRYNITAAAERIRATGYPGADRFAADHVLAPVSEETALARLEKAELR